MRAVSRFRRHHPRRREIFASRSFGPTLAGLRWHRLPLPRVVQPAPGYHHASSTQCVRLPCATSCGPGRLAAPTAALPTLPIRHRPCLRSRGLYPRHRGSQGGSPKHQRHPGEGQRAVSTRPLEIGLGSPISNKIVDHEGLEASTNGLRRRGERCQLRAPPNSPWVDLACSGDSCHTNAAFGFVGGVHRRMAAAAQAPAPTCSAPTCHRRSAALRVAAALALGRRGRGARRSSARRRHPCQRGRRCAPAPRVPRDGTSLAHIGSATPAAQQAIDEVRAFPCAVISTRRCADARPRDLLLPRHGRPRCSFGLRRERGRHRDDCLSSRPSDRKRANLSRACPALHRSALGATSASCNRRLPAVPAPSGRRTRSEVGPSSPRLRA
jgi:hypothetical protein